MTSGPITLPPLGPMHEAVGNGISVFASVEFAVAMCFASMLEPANRLHSVTVINSARSFEAKMKTVDALADVALESELRDRWRNLSSKITRRKAIRDKLAHWSVGLYPGVSCPEDISKSKAALVPPFWSKQHMQVMWDGSNSKSKPLFLNQIVEFTGKCTELASDLIKFSDDIQNSGKDTD